MKFYQNPFAAFSVKLPVKDLFPGTEIHLSVGHSHYHLPAHQCPFDMGIGIILKSVMFVLAVRLFRSKFLKPHFKVMMQSGFIIIDKNTAVICMAFTSISPSFIPDS